jgi:hypothetical protein
MKEQFQMTEVANVQHNRNPEVSVVIPCLNEADTLATCIRKAEQALRDHHIAGEIIAGVARPKKTI